MENVKISISMSDIFSVMKESGFDTAQISGFTKKLTDRPDIKNQLHPDNEEAIQAKVSEMLGIKIH